VPDFSDPTFKGEGRDNPPPRQPTKRGLDGLGHLNFARGIRVRVIKDNGKRGLLGLEGVVMQSFPGEVVVELENDPLIGHRANMIGGMVLNKRPMRHFRVTEVERV
jgi:hypothetical protein